MRKCSVNRVKVLRRRGSQNNVLVYLPKTIVRTLRHEKNMEKRVNTRRILVYESHYLFRCAELNKRLERFKILQVSVYALSVKYLHRNYRTECYFSEKSKHYTRLINIHSRAVTNFSTIQIKTKLLNRNNCIQLKHPNMFNTARTYDSVKWLFCIY